MFQIASPPLWRKKEGKCYLTQLNIIGLLFDDIFGEEEAAHDNEENEMANFIVDDGISYGDRSPMRYILLIMKPSKLLFMKAFVHH